MQSYHGVNMTHNEKGMRIIGEGRGVPPTYTAFFSLKPSSVGNKSTLSSPTRFHIT